MPKIDISVRELVDMIDRGELRLPELQRRYVWPATSWERSWHDAAGPGLLDYLLAARLCGVGDVG